jgi:hypothetical protein
MRNDLTYKQVDSLALANAGLVEQDINPLIRQRIVYNAVLRIYAILDGLNDPFYNLLLSATPVNNVIDLETIFVKSVLNIYDDQDDVSGNTRPFDEITDPKEFTLLHRQPVRRSRVCWFLSGSRIYLFVGDKAKPLGEVIVLLRNKPSPFTDASQNTTILIPPEENSALTDEVTAAYLEQVKQPVPASLSARLGYYKDRYAAMQTDKESVNATHR